MYNTTYMKIILASKSPRRKEILQKFFKTFDIKVSDVDETFCKNTPEENVMDISCRKAAAINEKDTLIIASDTTVYLNKYYGKPKNKENAFEMLKELSGKGHFVYTGVALKYNDKIKTFYDVAKVKFKELKDSDIDYYLEKYQPYDKAGSYGVQDNFIVENFEGDYFTIMGLPFEKLEIELKNFVGEIDG